jgi:hypothetical protein
MSSNSFITSLDHSDDQLIVETSNNNDISNFDDNIIPNSSELDTDMLSINNAETISQQNSDSTDSTINAGTSTINTTTTSKKVFKKKPVADPNYIFGYIPNYKIPFINIHISYPIDVISNKIR